MHDIYLSTGVSKKASYVALGSSYVNCISETTNIYFLCFPEFVLVIPPSGNSFNFTFKAPFRGTFICGVQEHRVQGPPPIILPIGARISELL